jgi:tetratricopeptide (TPR) repeat protein
MAVTFPFALLLFDVWPLRRWQALRGLVEKLPFFALAALSSVATYVVQRNGGAMNVAEPMSFGARVANAFVAYARYVGKTLVPTDLAIIYPHPIGGWPSWAVLAAVLGFIAVSVVSVRALSRSPWLFVGWFFFVGVLVPTIGIVQVGAQSMADRYSYLPTTGLFIAGVWSAHAFIERRREGGQKTAATTVGIAVGALAAVCGALTLRQAGYFQDGVTVFRHAIAVTSPNVVANARLGSALSKEGKLAEAESAYRAAIAVAPNAAIAHAELGAVLVQMGRLDEAIAEDEEAIRLTPTLAIAHYNLGRALLKRREVERALAHLQLAVQLAPDSPESHTGLGFGLTDAHQFDAAIAEFETAIRLSPHGTIGARDGLAVALVRSGRLGEAVGMFQSIVALDPSRAVGHANLGNALVDSGRVDEGIAELELAVRLEPGNAMSHYGLASALYSRGRVREAVTQYRESVRIDPTNQDVQRELATAVGGASPK